MCHGTDGRVRAQTVGAGSLLACRSLVLNSGCQAWWHVPFLAGPFCWPRFLSFKLRRLSSKWRPSDIEEMMVGSSSSWFFSPDPIVFPRINGDCKSTLGCNEFEIFPHLSLPAGLPGKKLAAGYPACSITPVPLHQCSGGW